MATPHPPTTRSTWLVFGADAIASQLPVLMPGVDIRVATASTFPDELESGRPRVVILAAPPAQAMHLAAVTTMRRRSPAMVRTVLLTAPDDVPGRIEALAIGFDDALPITIDARELTARLHRRNEWGRTAGTSQPIPIADGVDLDLEAYALRRNGQPEPLRPKEFQLLALLATHPRRAFTRAELIDRIWGPAFSGDPRTIDVHLRWLRSKVEAAPDRPRHLMTVRGRGYRFDPPG